MSKKIKTTRKYLRRRFLSVILATFAFIFLPIFLVIFLQGSSTRINNAQVYADELLQDSWQDIDASNYVEDGGSVMIVDSSLDVVYLVGDDISEGKESFNSSDWTEFLRNTGKDNEYEYGVAYKESNDGYWLILRKPISVGFTFSFSLNPESKDFKSDAALFLVIILIYWIALITFIIFLFQSGCP